MQDAKTWVIAVVALIVGAGIGYFYAQRNADTLMEQVVALEADLGEKTSLIEEQQARIAELEAR